MSTLQQLETTDSHKVRREKINANFLLLQAKRQNIIASINNSEETEKIALSRIATITVDGAEVTDIPWANVVKGGSSLADLTTRSAAALSSGLLADARLSANIPRLDAINSFLDDLVFGANKAMANGITKEVSSTIESPRPSNPT